MLIWPCGVSTLNSILRALPVIVPATAVSPAWLLMVPATLSAVCVKFAVAGIGLPAMLNVMSHLPETSVVLPTDALVADTGTAAAAAAGAGEAAEAAVFFLAVQGTSPIPPKFKLPVIESPATVPVILISMLLPCRFKV